MAKPKPQPKPQPKPKPLSKIVCPGCKFMICTCR